MEPEAHERVREVLASGYIGQGEQVELFEEELREFLGSKVKPVTTNSGTSAIQLAIEVICGKGDGTRHILVPPLTCVATIAAIVDAGYKPRWMEYSGKSLREVHPPVLDDRTAAVLLVDFAGQGIQCRYRYECPVIVDAAHGLGTDYTNVKHNSYRNAICYSFQAIKHLTTGDGGAVLFNHWADMEKAVLHRWFGLDRTSSKDFRCEQNIHRLGHKWHMNDIAAAIGRANLKGLAADLKRRREISQRIYTSLPLYSAADHTTSENRACWIHPLFVNNRDAVRQTLAEAGFASSPVHRRCDTHPCMDALELKTWDDRRQTDALADSLLCVPCGWWMTDDDVTRLIETLKQTNPLY